MLPVRIVGVGFWPVAAAAAGHILVREACFIRDLQPTLSLPQVGQTYRRYPCRKPRLIEACSTGVPYPAVQGVASGVGMFGDGPFKT